MEDDSGIIDDPRIGSLVDERYKVLEAMASGSMGVVYKGERVPVGKLVAIKFLHATFANDAEFLARFERETRVMSKLTHPNCVSVVDFGVWDGAPYLVMEYVSGTTLRALIDNGALPPRRALALGRQIAAGLAHAHAQGVVHRDVKPANIMISEEIGTGDHARILDFGLARLRGAVGRDATQTNVVVGTPNYMAPEQTVGGGLIDARTDIYAVGVVLFEMLTGDRPFQADDTLALLGMHRAAPIPQLAERLEPDAILPDGLQDIVDKAMAKSPGDRYQSAIELAEAIDEITGARDTGPIVRQAYDGKSGAVRTGAAAAVTRTGVTAVVGRGRAGRDGRDGNDAGNGGDVLDARDGLDAHDGRDDRDARDGRDDRDARDGRDDRDARDGRHGREGRDGLDAREGRNALAARDSHGAKKVTGTAPTMLDISDANELVAVPVRRRAKPRSIVGSLVFVGVLAAAAAAAVWWLRSDGDHDRDAHPDTQIAGGGDRGAGDHPGTAGNGAGSELAGTGRSGSAAATAGSGKGTPVDPTGTNPTGTNPTGTNPTGTGPTGTGPTGTGPTGTGPTGTGPTGTGPTGTGPTGTGPTGSNAAGTGDTPGGTAGNAGGTPGSADVAQGGQGSQGGHAGQGSQGGPQGGQAGQGSQGGPQGGQAGQGSQGGPQGGQAGQGSQGGQAGQGSQAGQAGQGAGADIEMDPATADDPAPARVKPSNDADEEANAPKTAEEAVKHTAVAPSAPALATTLAGAVQLIQDDKRDLALASLHALWKKTPQSAYIPFLLGNLYYDQRWWSVAMDHYAAAIKKNGQYRANPTLNRNVIRMLASNKTARKAQGFLKSTVGKSAVPYLRTAAKQDSNLQVRRLSGWLLRSM